MCKFGRPRMSTSLYQAYMFSSITLSIPCYICIPICEIPNVTTYSHVQVDSFKQLELCTRCDVSKKISVHIVMMAR
jgi:hypothetical protein